jgi:hypothetical protein
MARDHDNNWIFAAFFEKIHARVAAASMLDRLDVTKFSR